MIKKLEKWKRKKLEIFWLPTYSPKPNFIETLRKFMKYEEIEVDAYESWDNFRKYFKKVLDNFGEQEEYVINFVQLLSI